MLCTCGSKKFTHAPCAIATLKDHLSNLFLLKRITLGFIQIKIRGVLTAFVKPLKPYAFFFSRRPFGRVCHVCSSLCSVECATRVFVPKWHKKHTAYAMKSKTRLTPASTIQSLRSHSQQAQRPRTREWHAERPHPTPREPGHGDSVHRSRIRIRRVRGRSFRPRACAT